MDLKFDLHPKQKEVFLDDSRFKVCAAGRRAGKTYLAVVTLLIEALKEENRFVFLFVGQKYGTWPRRISKPETLSGVC